MSPTNLISVQDEDFNLPTWNSFNSTSIADTSEQTLIAYGQILPASPTNAGVVKASLKYFMDVALKLNQRHTIVTCDQAIYEIALALRKKSPGKYGTLILRMGSFHIARNCMGSIGMIMKQSGLEDILARLAFANAKQELLKN